MAKKRKGPGRPARPAALKKRHKVMVAFDDGEILKVRDKAQKQPVAVYVREKALS